MYSNFFLNTTGYSFPLFAQLLLMKFKPFTAEVETQTIYLNKMGVLQNSCDSLFSTQGWKKDTILTRFPLLKSIFAGLASMQVGNPPIHIPKVESDTGLPPGFYDFSFTCLQVEEDALIRWVIYDYTREYRNLQHEQQASHNAYIAKDKRL